MPIRRRSWKLGNLACAYCGVPAANTRDHPIPLEPIHNSGTFETANAQSTRLSGVQPYEEQG